MYLPIAAGQGPAAAPPAQRARSSRRKRGSRTGAGQSTPSSSQAASNQPGPSSGGQTNTSQLFFPVDVRRRKLPGGRCTSEEAPLSEEQRSRIQKRQKIQSNVRKCRTCTLNNSKNTLCTRFSLPEGSTEACDRCDRLGIQCVDLLDGTVFQPRMELTGTGRRNSLIFYPCNNCTENSLCCDRARPCAQCWTRGIECIDAKRSPVSRPRVVKPEEPDTLCCCSFVPSSAWLTDSVKQNKRTHSFMVPVLALWSRVISSPWVMALGE